MIVLNFDLIILHTLHLPQVKAEHQMGGIDGTDGLLEE